MSQITKRAVFFKTKVHSVRYRFPDDPEVDEEGSRDFHIYVPKSFLAELGEEGPNWPELAITFETDFDPSLID